MIRAGAILLAFAAAMAGGAAAAQPAEMPTVVSPLRVEADHNNVNLVSGKTTIEPPSLSVPGAPHLRFDRVQNSAPYVAGRVSGGAGTIPTGNWSVHTGAGASESFECTDFFDCGAVTGTGSVFRGPAGNNGATSTYRQAGTGAVYSFNRTSINSSTVRQAYASTATYPNGEVITYTYDTATAGPFGQILHRPTRVSSSMGYHITIAYPSNDVYDFGWGSPSEAAIFNSAAPGVPLGRLTYNEDGTITDLGGRIHACAGCQNALGAPIEVVSGSTRLPGETAPALQVAAVPAPNTALVGSVVRDGVQWTYAYLNPRLNSGTWLYDRLTVTGPNGFNQVYTIVQLGLGPQQRNVVTSMRDSIQRTTQYQFDAAYRPTRIILPEGNQTSVVYDPAGNVIQRTTTPKPGMGAAIIETASYPLPADPNISCHVACWRPTWSRDALGRQTDYLYNASGQMIQQDDPADSNGVGRRTIVDYAATPAGISRPVAVRVCGVGTTCGTNAEIRTEYDYWGDTMLPTVERRIDAAAGITLETHHSYDPAGRLLSTDGPMPGGDDTIYNRYDVHGRRTWEIGARGANGVRIATRTTWRQSDDKISYTETGTIPDEGSIALTVLARTDTGYDAHRNPNREATSASGTTNGVVERSFDDRGRRTCEARRMNPAAFATPLANVCVPGPQGSGAGDFGPDRIARNNYDAADQLLQAESAVGTPLQQTDAAYTYSLNGKRTSFIDGNGNRAEMSWDGFDRQRRWIFPSPTVVGTANPNDYEEYGYDAAGNRTSLRKRDGSLLTYQYDNLNRLIVKVVPERAGLTAAQTRDIYYGYDLRNSQTFARFDSDSGEGITSAYDGFGRLASSTTNMGGTSRTLTYQYVADGSRIWIGHPDNQWFGTYYDTLARPYYLHANGTTGIAYTYYTALGQPAIVNRTNNASSGYNYDPIQRPTVAIHYFPGSSQAVWTYAWTPASQLAGETRYNDAFAYVQANTSQASTINGLNQPVTAAVTGAGGPGGTIQHDMNGNLIADPGLVGGGGAATAYLYDVENRLVSASGARNAMLAYDPLGRLWQVASGGTTRTFLYDGDALVAEYNGSTLLRRHAHNVGADVPMITYEGSDLSQPRWLYADRQGSIVATAGANGVPAINRYDEYGIPAAANTGTFGYTGQMWLPEIGLYHYKARVYSPTLGRFMQTDPVGYEGGNNLYGYVENDPLNQSDPMGLAGGSGCGTRIFWSDSASCSGETLAGSASYTKERNARGPRTFSAEADSGGGGGNRPGIGHNQGPPLEEGGKLLRFLGRFGGFLVALLWSDPAGVPDEASDIHPSPRPTPVFPSNPGQLGHMFRNETGHYPRDTPEARAALIDTARSGYTIRRGNHGDWFYGRLNPDGSETWVQVRNGVVQNGGVNIAR